MLQANGNFTDEVPDFKGMHVKAADDAICAALKAAGRLVQKGVLTHSYPFCWRSDTPLIYRAVPSWSVGHARQATRRAGACAGPRRAVTHHPPPPV